MATQHPLTVGFSYLVREASRFLGYGRAAVYATGTLTIVSGAVTLAGGTFPSWLNSSGSLIYNDQAYTIASITDSTHLTLYDTTLSASAGASYWVVPLFPDQATDLIDCYRSGLRTFYNPPVLPGERFAHRWSFLFPETTVTTNAAYGTGTIQIAAGVVTLTGGTWPTWAASGELTATGLARYTVASRDSGTQLTLTDTTVTLAAGTNYSIGQWVFPLSADFAALVGPLTFDSNGYAAWIQVPFTSAQAIHVQRAPFPITGRPLEAALRQKETFDPTIGTRYELLLWPTPNAEYTLRYRYECNPNNLDATNAYIRGGQPHMETMLEAVLAACEQKLNDQIGMHKQLFMERLAASVSHDRKAGSPDSIGFDHLSQLDDSLRPTDYHDWFRTTATYNGV